MKNDMTKHKHNEVQQRYLLKTEAHGIFNLFKVRLFFKNIDKKLFFFRIAFDVIDTSVEGQIVRDEFSQVLLFSGCFESEQVYLLFRS